MPLPDVLVEEVLLRFPPENPAWLVRAGLVCTRWCRIVSDPGFHRRFREFHRDPPMLGMLFNLFCTNLSRFIPTTAFRIPRDTDFPRLRVLDARHGRVLGERGSVLVVWDPITDTVRELRFPQNKLVPWADAEVLSSGERWTAAVLCSAASATCDHLDCHQGPFLVVLVCSQRGQTSVYTYSSDAAAWSEPAVIVFAQRDYLVESSMGSALVGNALYFGNLVLCTALKYNVELRQVSCIQLPSLSQRSHLGSMLTTTEDGGLGLVNRDDDGLGLVNRDCAKLYIWSRKDTHQVDAKWQRRIIELNTLFPVDFDVTKLFVKGTAVGTIFMKSGENKEVYTIDLKTYKVKKVYDNTSAIHTILPYMSFYTPVLRVATTGEGPSASASTAVQTKGADKRFSWQWKIWRW